MLRVIQDNVLVLLEPKPTETVSGIQLVHMKGPGAREHRTAKVIAVGPGHHPGCKACGGVKPTFIPTTLKPGDRIVVDALCGNKWNMDVSSVRQNERTDFDSMLGERGDWRVIREGEALAVLEDEARAAE
jgi:co-chaperonin GroES (HSP10)